MSPSENKKPKGSKKITKPSDVPSEGNESQSLSENLYKKNIELLTKNKTLSLLRKLYEISILTLKPQDLAVRVSQTVQVDLSFELVGILIFEPESASLIPLAFSKSERVRTTMEKLHLSFDDLKIPIPSQKFFEQVVHSEKENRTDNLDEVWCDLIDPSKLQTMASEDHIKTTLLYPLKVKSKVLGTIMLALNRNYEALSLFEKESIMSFVNVIALSLEKAFLYQELESANVQLRELDKQKDAVLHMVSHQFRTPLTAIKWTVEGLLEGENLNDEQKENLATIQTVSCNLGDQADMILQAAKITQGKKLLCEPAPLDLNYFLKGVINNAIVQSKERKVKLNISAPSQLPTVMLDRKFTQWAFDNLLSNAIKYTAQKMEDGSGNVDFTIEFKNNVLYCIVKDNGIGIPDKDKDKMFKELSRASNAGSEGTGLGLHVAKGSIESQGGKIHFESTENVGTTFFVEMPLKIATKEDFEKQKEQEKEKN